MRRVVTLLLGIGAIAFLPRCAGPGGGSSDNVSRTSWTKEVPFVNSLDMKFVPVPGTKILMCITETTVAQFRAAGIPYRTPPFAQTSNDPAVNISSGEANAWCLWLAKKEGRKYRLPTESEWLSAAGNGTYSWGETWPPPSGAGNFSGQEWKQSDDVVNLMRSFGQKPGTWVVMRGYQDRHVFTAPVASYPPDHLGIYDLAGNAWEWCQDEQTGVAGAHGGSWLNSHQGDFTLRVSLPDGRADMNYGFRCVLEN